MDVDNITALQLVFTDWLCRTWLTKLAIYFQRTKEKQNDLLL